VEFVIVLPSRLAFVRFAAACTPISRTADPFDAASDATCQGVAGDVRIRNRAGVVLNVDAVEARVRQCVFVIVTVPERSGS